MTEPKIWVGTLIGPHGTKVGRFIAYEDYHNECMARGEIIAGMNSNQALNDNPELAKALQAQATKSEPRNG